jgi:hypothetical protein
VESNLLFVRNLTEFAQNLLHSATIKHTPGGENKLLVQIVHEFLGTLVVVPRAESNGKMPNDYCWDARHLPGSVTSLNWNKPKS